jgi:hypothetical protein
MFKPIRVVATILLIASIALVFVGAFVLQSEVSESCIVECIITHVDIIAAVYQ